MLVFIEENKMEYPAAHERVWTEYQLSPSQAAAVQRKYDTDPSGCAADL
jgi:hypothetical protein